MTPPAALLTGLATDRPDIPDAVRVGDEALSRSELLGAATAVADRVHGAAAVAVDAQPSLHTVVAAVGCLLAGTPLVPVPADVGSSERRHILTDSGAQLWLGAPRPEVTLPVVPVDPGARSSATYPEPDADATAVILYTSGTTGPPKGVVLSRRAVAADLDGLAQAWGWSPDDVLVHGLPLFHVHGLVLGVFGALRVGSPLRHTVRPRPQAYARARGSLYFGVPTVWSRIARDPDSARPGLGAAAGLRQRPASGPGVRGGHLAHRPTAGGTVRDERDADHHQHPARRRAPARLGRVAAAGSPHPATRRGRGGAAARRAGGRAPAGVRADAVR